MKKASKGIIVKTGNNLSDYAYQHIKKDILSKKYSPGAILSEIKISEEMPISRTPIKTALYNLALDGLVEIVPNKGYLVKNFGIKEIVEITQAREALESMIARLACERLTPNDISEINKLFPDTSAPFDPSKAEELRKNGDCLHMFLIKISGNNIIAGLLERLNNQVHQTNSVSSQFPERIEEAYYEHCKLVDALNKRDANLAEKVMREHIANQRVALIKQMLL